MLGLSAAAYFRYMETSPVIKHNNIIADTILLYLGYYGGTYECKIRSILFIFAHR